MVATNYFHLAQAEAEELAAGATDREGLTKLREESAALKAMIDKLDVSIRELKQVALNQAAEVVALSRVLSRAQSTATALVARQRDVEETAAMEQVQLPVVTKKAAGRKRGRGSRKTRKTAAVAVEEGENNDEEQHCDDEEDKGADDGSSPDGTPKSPSASTESYDFSSLPEELRLTDPASRARVEMEHEQMVASLRASLERLTPNLKAFEQYEAVRDREREQLEELDGARRRARSATSAFETVRSSRHEAFLAAFQHVSRCIDKVYKVGVGLEGGFPWLAGVVGKE